MANRSQRDDRTTWKLPRRRQLDMRKDTRDRALGVRDGDGVATFPTRAEQHADQGQGRSGERQGQ